MAASITSEAKTLLDSLPEPAFVVSLEKTLVAMNAAAEALTGMTGTAAAGRRCADVVRCEACGESCPLDAALAQGRAVTNFNVQLTSAHGDQAVSLHTAPLRNASGALTGVLECVRPIGHLVGLFQALQEKTDQVQLERNKVRAVLDSIAEGVFTVSSERQVTSVNRTGARILGQTEPVIVGKTCHRLVRCGAENAGVCPTIRVLAGGRGVTNFETEFVDGNGRTVPVSLSVSALRDEHGEIIGAVEAFRDLRDLMAPVSPRTSLIAGAPHMHRVMELIDVLKDSDATVLLQGESGTGKGLIAETIHRLGNRAHRPFVKVNCAALPENLLESELFGHVKGAFTGAIRDTVGRFELADGGTAFLDEVGELSLATQIKLLRFLQEQEFERVGSAKTVRVNVRVVAATNQDLRHLMLQGRFRPDLFYRLNVIPIELPPLRERREDIPAMVEHILSRLTSKGRKVHTVSPEVMDVFLRYPWPGNIRELENTLEHAIVCSKGSAIELPALPRSVLKPTAVASHPTAVTDSTARTLETLERYNGNQSAAARALGINRTTVWRRLRKRA